jgi:hypothetical protein
MTRVLAAALLSVFAFTASAGLAVAATPAANSGTAPIASTHKATDSAKPVTKKKDKTVSTTVAKPAVKTQETGKSMAKPHS